MLRVRYLFWSLPNHIYSWINPVYMSPFRDHPYITSYILEVCMTPTPPYCHQLRYYFWIPHYTLTCLVGLLNLLYFPLPPHHGDDWEMDTLDGGEWLAWGLTNNWLVLTSTRAIKRECVAHQHCSCWKVSLDIAFNVQSC